MDGMQGTALPLESKLRVLTVISEAGAMQETWQLILQLQSEVEKEISRLEDILGEDNPMLRVLVKVLGDIPNPRRSFFLFPFSFSSSSMPLRSRLKGGLG